MRMRCSVAFEVVGAPVLGVFFIFKTISKNNIRNLLRKNILSAEILLAWLNYVVVFLI